MPDISTLLNLGRRMAAPFLARRADDIVDGTLSYAIQSPEHLEGWLPETGQTLHQWLRDTVGELKLGSTWTRLKQEVHSPDMILGDMEPGRRILNSGSYTQLDKGKFLHPILEKYNKARGGIVEESEASARAFNALQDPSLVVGLDKKEKGLYDFLKETYDYTAKTYTRFLAKDDATYNTVMRLVGQKESVDQAIVDALPEHAKLAYDFAKRRIENYAPHFFDREQLIEMFQNTLTNLQLKQSQATSPKAAEKIGKTMKDYVESISRLSGGDPLAWEILPKDFLFRHELVRKGAEGYRRDAIKSFNNYIFSLARKMFDEPAIKSMAEDYKQLPFHLRPYAKWFIRDFAGYNQKNVWDQLAGQIAGFEYLRTLGWNLRSPIVNLTQQVNTWVDAGLKWSKVGYVRMYSPEMKALWKESGLGIEVPQALTEDLGVNATKADKLRRVFGYFFNKAEGFNRKHAFSTYFSKYEHLGEAEAMKKAIDGVHKTQFQYGKMGMPKLLRSAPGRVGLQFSSYSIKQIEFLQKLIRENPKKALMWVGGTTVGNWTLQELLGLDLSNALGFGVNLGEAVQMVRSASKGELADAWMHGKMSFAQGTGLLPSGPGPFVGSLIKITSALSRGEKVPETVWKELKPIAWQRVDDLLESVLHRAEAPTPGKIPVFKGAEALGEVAPSIFGEPRKEMVMEETPFKTGVQQLFRTTERTKKTAKWYKEIEFDRRDSARKQEIARLIVAGRGEKAGELIKKWKVVPTRDAVYEELLRKHLPREMRKDYIMRELRQRIREGETG